MSFFSETEKISIGSCKKNLNIFGCLPTHILNNQYIHCTVLKICPFNKKHLYSILLSLDFQKIPDLEVKFHFQMGMTL